MSSLKWAKVGPLFWAEEYGDYYIRSYRSYEGGRAAAKRGVADYHCEPVKEAA